MSPDSELCADDSLASPFPLCVSPQIDAAPIVDVGDEGSISDVAVGLRAPAQRINYIIINNQNSVLFYHHIVNMLIPGSGLIIVDGD